MDFEKRNGLPWFRYVNAAELRASTILCDVSPLRGFTEGTTRPWVETHG
jgi:hypothetical protein